MQTSKRLQINVKLLEMRHITRIKKRERETDSQRWGGRAMVGINFATT
jgi:hypothetical protein